MTEQFQTKLGVENPHRLGGKIRMLTPEQLGIPSDDESEEATWDILEEAVASELGDDDIGVAVRTEDGDMATGVRLSRGKSHTVHPIELAVWSAYAEQQSPIQEVFIDTAGNETEPCGRCIQVLKDYAVDDPSIRVRTDGEDNPVDCDSPDFLI